MTTPADLPGKTLLFYLIVVFQVFIARGITLRTRFLLALLMWSFSAFIPVPRAPNVRAKATKVFGIGLSRTGTTSLASGMRELGYYAMHAPPELNDYYNITYDGNNRRDLALPVIRPYWVEAYDFQNDIQVSLNFRQLAALYPRAKFILTKREPKSWAAGAFRFFNGHKSLWKAIQTLEETFGPMPDASAYLFHATYGDWENYGPLEWEQVYREFEDDVVEFFAKEDDDRLLVMDVTAGEGYDCLCPFLGSSEGGGVSSSPPPQRPSED